MVSCGRRRRGRREVTRSWRGSPPSSTWTPTSSSRPTCGPADCRPATAKPGRTSSSCRPVSPSSSGPVMWKNPEPTVPTWPGGATRTTGPRSSARSPRPAFHARRLSCVASATTRCGPGVGASASGSRTWTSTGCRPNCAFRTTPGSAASSSSGARTGSWPRLCVEAYNDWMVEEWCGEGGGRLLPLCLVPLWDADLAAAEVTRNASARRAGGGVHRAAAVPRSAEPVLRLLGPVPGGMPGDPHGGVHAHRFGHEDAAGVTRRPGRRRRHHPLRQQRGEPRRPALFWDAAPFPGSAPAVCRGADRLDPLRLGAGRRRVDDPPGMEQLAT